MQPSDYQLLQDVTDLFVYVKQFGQTFRQGLHRQLPLSYGWVRNIILFRADETTLLCEIVSKIPMIVVFAGKITIQQVIQ